MTDPKALLYAVNEHGITLERKAARLLFECGAKFVKHSVKFNGIKLDKEGKPFTTIRDVDVEGHMSSQMPIEASNVLQYSIAPNRQLMPKFIHFDFLIECKYNKTEPYILFNDDAYCDSFKDSIFNLGIKENSVDILRIMLSGLDPRIHNMCRSIQVHHKVTHGISFKENGKIYNKPNDKDCDAQFHKADEIMGSIFNYYSNIKEDGGIHTHVYIPVLLVSHDIFIHQLVDSEQEISLQPLGKGEYCHMQPNVASDEKVPNYFITNLDGLKELANNVCAIAEEIEGHFIKLGNMANYGNKLVESFNLAKNEGHQVYWY